MVDKDQDDAAIHAIRSLLLKQHYSLDDFKTKDIVIGTLQIGSKVLKSPSDVGKLLKDSKKSVYGAPVNKTSSFIVYQYTGDKFPDTVDGESKSVPFSHKGGNSIEIDRQNKIRTLVASFYVKKDLKSTIDNYFRAVAGLLIQLQDEDHSNDVSGLFGRAKFYLAANPVLSWSFLTMPGNENSFITIDHLNKLDIKKVVGTEIIKECSHVDYTFNKDLFKSINAERSKLLNERGDKSSLMGSILKSYESMNGELYKHKSIDDQLHSNTQIKILMDELRFMYEDSVSEWSDLDDAITAVSSIDWSKPRKYHVLTDSDVYKNSIVKSTEAFESGPQSFVRSVYFLYIPLTEGIESQLTDMIKQHLDNAKKGGVYGGSSSSTIIFNGGAARKLQSKSDSVKLESLVRSLSKAQRESLKSLL